MPPSERSNAATGGRAASRASARPSSAKRSASRSAAPASNGHGQVVGRRNCVSVIHGKAGREASSRSSGDRRRDGAALAGHAGDHAGRAGQCRPRGDRLAAVAGAGRPRLAHPPPRGRRECQRRSDPPDDRLSRTRLGRLPHGSRSAARTSADQCQSGGPGRRAANEHSAGRGLAVDLPTAVRACRATGGHTGFAADHLDPRGRRHAQPRSRQPDRDGGQRRAGVRSSGNTGRRPAGGVGAAAGQRSGTRIGRAAGAAPSGACSRWARRVDRSPAWRHLAGAACGDRSCPATGRRGGRHCRIQSGGWRSGGAADAVSHARGGSQRDPSTRQTVAGDAERDRTRRTVAGWAGHAGRTGRRRGHARSRCQPGSAPRSVQPPRRQRPGTCRRQQRAFPRRDAGGFGHAG